MNFSLNLRIKQRHERANQIMSLVKFLWAN